MSEPITYRDIEFHFTSGELLSVTLRDEDTYEEALDDDKLCVTIKQDDSISRLEVHRDKLNAVQVTTRIVQPDESPKVSE